MPRRSSAPKSPGRIGVIDIGSNSIRLVIFDRAARSLLQVFNEKVMCGLGRGLDKTGRLNAEGVASALENLPRFAAVAAEMGADEIVAFATAAVRDASDGPAFLAELRSRAGLDILLLSGDEEARLSALGVASAIPDADGIIGDLGGGSLELVSLRGFETTNHGTLPLGAFRLMREGKEKEEALIAVIDRHLERLSWLDERRGHNFYPVGGTWRTFARVHMERTDYPLHVIHGYAIDGAAAGETAALLGRLGRKSLSRLKGASKRRQETLPYGSLVLSRLIHKLAPPRVIFSAYGVREGIVFDRLPDTERTRDPLVAAAAEMAASGGRFQLDGELLCGWMAPLFTAGDTVPRNLRLAAAWLADITGFEHPDYRGEHAFHRVLRMPVVGVDHPGRAFLALVLLSRYEGDLEASFAKPARNLLGPEYLRAALITGLALRLAIAVSVGSTDVLRRSRLEVQGKQLRLIVPPRSPGFAGEVVTRRLEALARAADLGAVTVEREVEQAHMGSTVVFKASVDNVDLWRREILSRVPDVAFSEWPDYGDPADVEFFLLFQAEPGMFNRFPNLRAILATGAGVDGILKDPELPRHVPIARIVDPWMTTAMGQWVVHAVLHFARQMPAYAEQQRRKEWVELELWTDAAPRVGILGCGEIGGFAGRALAGLGFDVAGWTRSARDLGDIENFAGATALPEFLRRSDYLVCLLPLTPETEGLLNERMLSLLPKGAYVVNAGRGKHIVAADLLSLLDSGHLAEAFLDVTEPEPLPKNSPLWSHPKVRITPHVAGITNPYTAAAQLAENIRRVRAGEPLLNLVHGDRGY